jgi:uncharacterized protein (TIGR00255 family)
MPVDCGGEPHIKSMTGFGRGSASLDNLEVIVEVKAVNHRYLEIFLKGPRIYSVFEPEVRKVVAGSISRGKFDIVLTRVGDKGAFTQVAYNDSLAKGYYSRLLEMKENLGLKGEISVSDMLTLKEIFQPVEQDSGIEEEWPVLEAAVRDAISKLDEMRKAEGAALWADMEKRLLKIRGMAEAVQPLVGEIAAAAKERLAKRVQELTGGVQLDQDRLLQEVALIAERSDVTEELTRIHSHLSQFMNLGKMGSPLGRKLDFLLQEINREVNTLGAKAGSTGISPYVVNIKAELEKVREQTQNIE